MLQQTSCCLASKGKAAQSIWDFANMMLDLREQLDQLSITELVEAVLEKTGYVNILNAQATLEAKLGLKISKSSSL